MAELIASSADLARWIAAQLPGPDDPDTPWCTDPDPAPDAPTALVRISVAVTGRPPAHTRFTLTRGQG
ncbi:hypothetical protein [Nocardia sp. NPDC050435]|uniref:hypothetical protein n=1 Tax=Nocardia sp. NPDC050435 TaxID=3155040 RepID=UPI0033E127AA